MTPRFHWTVSQTEIVDVGLCIEAERCGIEAIRTRADFRCPHPLEWVLQAASETQGIRFIVGSRCTLPPPELYIEQLRLAANLLPGRILPEIDCGLAPPDKLRDFLAACGPLRQHGIPEMFIAGNSLLAAELGIRYGSCVLRLPCAESELGGLAGPLLHFGVEVGFQSFLICRKNHDEAIDAVRTLRAGFKKLDNGTHPRQECCGAESRPSNGAGSEPGLWTGVNPVPDAPAVAMFGSFEEVAQTILRYQRFGITQFMFMGWPAREEMEHFSKGVLPLLRTC